MTDGSNQGRRTRELFSPFEPRQISPLRKTDQNRAVLSAALEAAAKFKPGSDTRVPAIPVPAPTPDDAAAVAEQEFASLKMQYPGGTGRAAKDLATLLGGKEWLPPMTPDLLGQAFLLLVFADTGPWVIARLAPFAAKRVAATVIRSVQDFSHWAEPVPMQWAQALAAHAEGNLEVLIAIEEAIPMQRSLCGRWPPPSHYRWSVPSARVWNHPNAR